MSLTDCNYKCGGDPSYFCGSADRISVFTKTLSTVEEASSIIVASSLQPFCSSLLGYYCCGNPDFHIYLHRCSDYRKDD